MYLLYICIGLVLYGFEEIDGPRKGLSQDTNSSSNSCLCNSKILLIISKILYVNILSRSVIYS